MTFTRRIISFKVRPAAGKEVDGTEQGADKGGAYDPWMLDIEATAFLWHQVISPTLHQAMEKVFVYQKMPSLKKVISHVPCRIGALVIQRIKQWTTALV
jgi:hypothetical protein